MPTRAFRANPAAWFSLGLDMWMLGAEAATVVALRSAKLAAGGAEASEEAGRMVGEKIAAAMLLGQQAMLGQLGNTMPGAGAKAVAHYRRRVHANRKRLSKAR